MANFQAILDDMVHIRAVEYAHVSLAVCPPVSGFFDEVTSNVCSTLTAIAHSACHVLSFNDDSLAKSELIDVFTAYAEAVARHDGAHDQLLYVLINDQFLRIFDVMQRTALPETEQKRELLEKLASAWARLSSAVLTSPKVVEFPCDRIVSAQSAEPDYEKMLNDMERVRQIVVNGGAHLADGLCHIYRQELEPVDGVRSTINVCAREIGDAFVRKDSAKITGAQIGVFIGFAAAIKKSGGLANSEINQLIGHHFAKIHGSLEVADHFEAESHLMLVKGLRDHWTKIHPVTAQQYLAQALPTADDASVGDVPPAVDVRASLVNLGDARRRVAAGLGLS